MTCPSCGDSAIDAFVLHGIGMFDQQEPERVV